MFKINIHNKQLAMSLKYIHNVYLNCVQFSEFVKIHSGLKIK
jgi:hypothetical protein